MRKKQNDVEEHFQRRGAGHASYVVALSLVMLLGCSPTVKVEAPDEPIEINLNIKIEQDVRVRLDKDVNDLIAENPDIF